MKRLIRSASAAALALGLLAPVIMTAQESLTLERVAVGLNEPLFATSAPGDPNTLYIAEKTGTIRTLDLTTSTLSPTPFMTATSISTGIERGLLGLAFHPDFQNNGYFYINVTNTSGHTEIRRHQVTGSSVSGPTPVLSYNQPFVNNNGGWMGFHPKDGTLYIASGDGGSSNDPRNNAQDITNNLLGKILRIDVDGDDFPVDPSRNYAIPADNPFVGIPGDDEIFAYGLRNPWRNSFDRKTGALYIADVGQTAREELNFIRADSSGGENFGWRFREGFIAGPGSGPPPGLIDPIYDYSRGGGPLQGFSITGGYVYRGPIAELQDHYFFADFVNGHVWSFKYDLNDVNPDTDTAQFIDWTDVLTTDVGLVGSISSFAEDADGNLYIIDFGGEVFKITGGTVPEPTSLALLGLGSLLAVRRRRA